jgi:hypothetical protein
VTEEVKKFVPALQLSSEINLHSLLQDEGFRTHIRAERTDKEVYPDSECRP